MTTDNKIRLNVYISAEARKKLGKTPSKKIEELAMEKTETLEGMREAFKLLREEIIEIKRLTKEQNEEVQRMSGYLSDVSRGNF